MATAAQRVIDFIRRRWVTNVLKVGVGIAFLLVTMRYVFRVPIITDDFYLFADWARRRATESFGSRLDLGGLFEAGRILPVGTGFTPVWLDSIFASAATLGIPPDVVWRAWRVLAVVLAVAAASGFATSWELRRPFRRAKAGAPTMRAPWIDEFTTWFVVLAILVGSFIQIHALWANDPVTAYIYPAWGTCVLYFTYLMLLRPALAPGQSLPAAALVLGAIVGVVGVWFYELFLPALVLAALPIIVQAGRLTWQRRRRPALYLATAFAAFVAIPGVAFLIPRLSGPGTVSGDSWYPGTSYRLSGQSVETFWGALVTSFPGSSWDKSKDFVGALAGTQAVSVPLVTTIIVLTAAAWWLVRHQGDLAPNPPLRRLWSMRWAVGMLLLVGALVGPIAIQSVSSRWQDELGGGIGNVYTFWATSSTAAAVLIGVAVTALIATRSPWPGAAAGAAVAGIAIMQLSVNVQLEAQTQVAFPANIAVVKAIDSDPATGDPERCAAIMTLARFPFPDYYRIGIGNSVVTAWKAEHGTPFCSKTPTIFSEAYLGG